MKFFKRMFAPKEKETALFKREGRYFLNEDEYTKWKAESECVSLCKAGIEAQGNGEIEQAINIYELLLSRNFDGTAPYRGLCEIYHNQGRFKEEIRVIKHLRKVTPKERYKSNKYRWYDKRYDDLISRGA
jgi:tetratricopeptide (TPR) repeat protein